MIEFSLFLSVLLVAEVSAAPASFVLPQQAANNASFFLKINETLEWKNGDDVFRLSPRFIFNGNVGISFNASGQFLALLLAPGMSQAFDVTMDKEADGILSILTVTDDRVELQMNLQNAQKSFPSSPQKRNLLWFVLVIIVLLIGIGIFFWLRRSRDSSAPLTEQPLQIQSSIR